MTNFNVWYLRIGRGGSRRKFQVLAHGNVGRKSGRLFWRPKNIKKSRPSLIRCILMYGKMMGHFQSLFRHFEGELRKNLYIKFNDEQCLSKEFLSTVDISTVSSDQLILRGYPVSWGTNLRRDSWGLVVHWSGKSTVLPYQISTYSFRIFANSFYLLRS